MNFLSVLESKREGHSLSSSQIKELVNEFTAGRIPDYQMAAFLMAVYFRGLNPAETTALTLAMRDSGDELVFPKDARPLVDKHSTGGVGDKVSLPLAPLLACLGFRVPMISGRGLGITGGTLDKLDSIPGFQTSLRTERIEELVQNVGCVICGQTERMVPADRALYALRDVTATVPSIPLIVSSILSKKLAEGLQALVLDVKFGAAAFLRAREQARELAEAMVNLGNECGVKTSALLTSMNSPLGNAAGNWLEVKEAVACLNGEGPPDLRELVIACAAQLLLQTGKAQNASDANRTAADCLGTRAPLRKWEEMLAGQGADMEAYQHKLRLHTTAPVSLSLRAPDEGFVARCDGRIIGEIIRDLGGGRLSKTSAIDYEVGIDSLAKPGEPVEKDSVLARVHAPTETLAKEAVQRLQAAFQFQAERPEPAKLIAETIG
jgi:pyrimidine-nucleoside phosphorylase